VARSEWQARDAAELTVNIGDTITVRGFLDSAGWAEGQIEERIGWFPLVVALPSSNATQKPLSVSLR